MVTQEELRTQGAGMQQQVQRQIEQQAAQKYQEQNKIMQQYRQQQQEQQQLLQSIKSKHEGRYYYNLTPAETKYLSQQGELRRGEGQNRDKWYFTQDTSGSGIYSTQVGGKEHMVSSPEVLTETKEAMKKGYGVVETVEGYKVLPAADIRKTEQIYREATGKAPPVIGGHEALPIIPQSSAGITVNNLEELHAIQGGVALPPAFYSGQASWANPDNATGYIIKTNTGEYSVGIGHIADWEKSRGDITGSNVISITPVWKTAPPETRTVMGGPIGAPPTEKKTFGEKVYQATLGPVISDVLSKTDVSLLWTAPNEWTQTIAAEAEYQKTTKEPEPFLTRWKREILAPWSGVFGGAALTKEEYKGLPKEAKIQAAPQIAEKEITKTAQEEAIAKYNEIYKAQADVSTPSIQSMAQDEAENTFQNNYGKKISDEINQLDKTDKNYASRATAIQQKYINEFMNNEGKAIQKKYSNILTQEVEYRSGPEIQSAISKIQSQLAKDVEETTKVKAIELAQIRTAFNMPAYVAGGATLGAFSSQYPLLGGAAGMGMAVGFGTQAPQIYQSFKAMPVSTAIELGGQFLGFGIGYGMGAGAPPSIVENRVLSLAEKAALYAPTPQSLFYFGEQKLGVKDIFTGKQMTLENYPKGLLARDVLYPAMQEFYKFNPPETEIVTGGKYYVPPQHEVVEYLQGKREYSPYLLSGLSQEAKPINILEISTNQDIYAPVSAGKGGTFYVQRPLGETWIGKGMNVINVEGELVALPAKYTAQKMTYIGMSNVYTPKESLFGMLTKAPEKWKYTVSSELVPITFNALPYQKIPGTETPLSTVTGETYGMVTTTQAEQLKTGDILPKGTYESRRAGELWIKGQGYGSKDVLVGEWNAKPLFPKQTTGPSAEAIKLTYAGEGVSQTSQYALGSPETLGLGVEQLIPKYSYKPFTQAGIAKIIPQMNGQLILSTHHVGDILATVSVSKNAIVTTGPGAWDIKNKWIVSTGEISNEVTLSSRTLGAYTEEGKLVEVGLATSARKTGFGYGSKQWIAAGTDEGTGTLIPRTPKETAFKPVEELYKGWEGPDLSNFFNLLDEQSQVIAGKAFKIKPSVEEAQVYPSYVESGGIRTATASAYNQGWNIGKQTGVMLEPSILNIKGSPALPPIPTQAGLESIETLHFAFPPILQNRGLIINRGALEMKNVLQPKELQILQPKEIVMTKEMLQAKEVLQVKEAQIIQPKEIQIQEPIQIQMPKVIPKLAITIPLIPIVPTTLEEEIPKRKKKKERKKITAWIPSIMKKGKWEQISQPIEKSKAIQLGERVTLTTLAARFKITPSKRQIEGEEMKYVPNPELFRTYKIVRGRQIPLQYEWIEKKTHRLKPASTWAPVQKARAQFGYKHAPYKRRIFT